MSFTSAHQQAWELAGVLHRDVSSGNILILDDGEACVGILNDWDMCKYKEELEVATPGGPAFRSVSFSNRSYVAERN